MKNEPPSPVSIREISEVSTIEARAEGVENLSFPLNMNPIDAASRQLLKESLLRILDSFNNRERNVLEMRFGLIDGQAHTEEDVGIEFGVTRERIRQTHITPKTLVLDG
jgi:DNA-directed RNA polymerase sigma subunit (sigma70/sigma32)